MIVLDVGQGSKYYLETSPDFKCICSPLNNLLKLDILKIAS